MAQLPEDPEQVSVASGETDAYPTVWTFEKVEEVRVFVAPDDKGAFVEQVRGVDFTVAAGDWLNDGAELVFAPGRRPPAGARVLRQRRSPVRQDKPFGDLEDFKPLESEQAYDRLTRMAQENRVEAARAAAFPPGEAGQSFPPTAARIETMPIFDNNGDLRVMPAVDVLNSIGATFEDDGAWGAASDPLTYDDGAFA
ncbi:hypothetical protein [Brevundimonas sp.]|uniref:hypothetical protein n=1 Tax=Brevundimonas sp. TaxID=1871086 RepID=UPI0028A243FC|nr:hypothetical protein [Brevundimonas sp.]